MNRRIYKLFIIISVFSLLFALFFDVVYAIALLVSYSVAIMNNLLTIRFIDQSLNRKRMNRNSFIVTTIVKNLLYFLSFSLFLLYPKYGTIISVVFGLLLIRICIHIDNFISRKGGST